ncbi:MAG: leucine-rich repeat protein, partial [Firmicutes bacterium]|nr:leucine-rich repeat protein [Bacillota bacterium]
INSVTIPDSVMSIGEDGFVFCANLTEVIFGADSRLDRIEDEAFALCEGLDSIVIPDSVTHVGALAFLHTGLWKDSPDNSVVYADKWAVGYKGSVNGDLTIKPGTTGICVSAFVDYMQEEASPSIYETGLEFDLDYSGLTGVTLPDGLLYINYCAFEGLAGLNSIEIPGSVARIGEGAFSGTGIWNNADDDGIVYADKWLVGYKGMPGSDLVLRSDTVGIAAGAFRMPSCNSLTSVTISNAVTKVGYGVTMQCENLTIYAGAASKPDGWDIDWNTSTSWDNEWNPIYAYRPVVWGCILAVDVDCIYVVSLAKTENSIVNSNADNGMNDPYREGYTFGGWWTAQGGEGAPYASLTDVPNGITVYACWIPA